jgi:immune inhibitor A
MALMSTLVLAVPAKRGMWKTVKMADGTEVRVELRGDEFCSYWQAADGRQLTQNNKTGLYEIADIKAMAEKANKMRQSARRTQGNSPETRISIGGEHTPYIGTKKGLIILVQFNDKKFWPEHTKELYNKIANEENFNEMGFYGSVKDYFKAQSYGQFELDFDIAGPVTLPEDYAYYGKPTGGNNDNNRAMGELVKYACESVNNEINFNDYDWDGDGEADQVFILYAGHGQASWDDPNTIWPHAWTLTSALGSRLKLDNVYIDTYACSCELGGSEGQECIDGIGAICHEFSHCLGLADMYDTTYQTGNYGMGKWDLMDQGCYNGNSYLPSNYTSYERMYAGWIEPIELKENRQINQMKPLADTGEAYIIYNERSKNEYYMLENRQTTGWDSGLPNSGLLITHVDFNSMVWGQNRVNSTSRQRCTIFIADNMPNRNEAGDIYPYGANDELTNTSLPAATLNNINKDGSKYMNKSIRNITRNSDGTVSFSFENENDIESDYELPESYIFYESFDQCDGEGGNDGNFDTTPSGSIIYDNEGWTSTSSASANQCGLFGSSTKTGNATTPEITIEGTYTLQFKAAPQGSEGKNIYIKIKNGQGELSKSSFTLAKSRWYALSTNITANGPLKISFYVTSGSFYLDKVCLSNTSTGISNTVTDNEVKDNRIFSIDGRYMGKDLNSLKKGIYIINGKKIIK